MTKDLQLRDHLLYLLRGGGAHISFEDFIGDFPASLINCAIEGVPYTPWQVLEHMRIGQWDILEFSRDANHVSPKFPEGYWPAAGDADAKRWNETVQAFRSDLLAMESLVDDPSVDLFARIAHGDGQTVLRETLLIADHNAYHLGTLALIFLNIAGPEVSKKPLISCRRYAADCPLVFLGILVQEVIGQELDIFTAVAQRRHVNSNRGNAIEEIVAQHAVANGVGRRAIG